ncbi:hypothetical protein GSI_06517 [Ganoderma sinense ZZ0214-1]|uniref:Methyltransferase domain-containing protein n=1 Tax=Ganoderma sinense ZZ0214-1 TaxID=1077348 RepID=A0A2G8SDJ1_9APHY|nr:hypothetical protein GSI_06517 [Ganoderma sinense ZZ0214-1]
MPPDYEMQSYWNARFENESHFEWLGDGSDTIIPHLRTHLLSLRVPSPSRPARLLHIGAGTSSLSERIRELYHNIYGPQVDEQAIVNVDFAETLVAREREKEATLARGWLGTGMQWICADALKWKELEAALHWSKEERAFDLIVDKSTSDAISCAQDISYSSPDLSLHPVLKELLAAQEGQKLSVPPVQLLAIHLASLVCPGGLWVALTFSSTRFSFLSSLEPGDNALPSHAAIYWDVEKIVALDAPTGMDPEGGVYGPVVQHYVFLIRRKDI